MKEKIVHFFQSISTKVILIILVLVLPLNVLAIVLSNRTMETMVEQAELSVKSIMQSYVTDLQNRMGNAQYFLYSMRNEDTDGLRIAHEEDTDVYTKAKINFFYTINRTYELVDGADGYFFYVKNQDDLLIWKDNSGGVSQTTAEAFVRTEIENGYDSGWSLKALQGEQILCLFTEIDGVIYGGWIHLEPVLRQLAGDIQYQKAVFQILEEKEEAEISIYSKKGNFYFTGELDRNEITGSLSAIYTVMRFGAMAALILIPLLYIGISRLLLRPLKTVNHAQKMLREGNLDYRINQKANSIEYQYSFQSFNEMADDIKNLKIESYEKELARQQMELRNLQLQIRPHFLLNTFNLIYTLTQRHETEAVQNIILYLSDYFRYLFRSGKDLELFEKEQNLIEGYLNMASVRYPGSIEWEFSYDPEIRFVRLPPLLLHNFVENIVKYAVQQEIVTHISIVGQYADRTVTFLIMDDGPGIEPDKLEEVNRDMRKKKNDGSHIGFANSLRRVKFFYGEEADILLTSELGSGTCVEIRFPYNLEADDEFTDCE
ncbi:MAG: histidine kinase [Eubacteriales bacterium]|nr:histidine kinase [Eubacteriales bacterium]